MRASPSRVWSIVLTVFGDAVVPRGGSIWLGTLLSLFAAIGVGPNAVRTAMSRLTADGWLERARSGRNSFYHLSERGRAEFAAATHRIYDGVPGWDGTVGLAVAAGLPVSAAAQAALLRAGFGAALPGVWVAAEPVLLPSEAAGMAFLRLAPDTAPADEGNASRRLVRQAFPLDASAVAFRRFIASFAALRGWAERAADRDALLARVLLIHQYRRIVLRAPRLPAELLPADWPGHDARRLCASLYRTLLPASERWLDREAATEAGPLPSAGPELAARFEDVA